MRCEIDKDRRLDDVLDMQLIKSNSKTQSQRKHELFVNFEIVSQTIYATHPRVIADVAPGIAMGWKVPLEPRMDSLRE